MKKIVYTSIIFLVVLVLISVLGLDIKTAKLFYMSGGDPIWKYSNLGLWKFSYRYGYILPNLIGVSAFLLILVSFYNEYLKPWRKRLILAVLLLLIGPGLITQTLKVSWGRPRPVEIKGFGGKYEFRTPFNPNFSLMGNKNDGNSFPSGHASIGFYLLVLYFILDRKKRFLLVGLAYGGLMGFGRMAQGGHFLSDILTSLFIVYITAEALYIFLGINKKKYKES
ncbi:MAG: phosphatase PAP2 family protein [bacterium]